MDKTANLLTLITFLGIVVCLWIARQELNDIDKRLSTLESFVIMNSQNK